MHAGPGDGPAERSGRWGPYRQASPPTGPAPPRRPVCAPAALSLPVSSRPPSHRSTTKVVPMSLAEVDVLPESADAGATQPERTAVEAEQEFRKALAQFPDNGLELNA